MKQPRQQNNNIIRASFSPLTAEPMVIEPTNLTKFYVLAEHRSLRRTLFCLSHKHLDAKTYTTHGRTRRRWWERGIGLEVPLRSDPASCPLIRTYKTTTAEHLCISRAFAATREPCGRF